MLCCQVVLARQLANQPSQLPLQRLTSEQIQQLQLQVQDHQQRQRQAAPGAAVQQPTGAAAGGNIGNSEQSWMQGYNHLLDRAAPDQRFALGGLVHLHTQSQQPEAPGAEQQKAGAAKEAAIAAQAALDLASASRAVAAAAKTPAAAPVAAAQPAAASLADPNATAGAGTPSGLSVSQPQLRGPSPRATAALTAAHLQPAQPQAAPASNGNSGNTLVQPAQPPSASDLSNVRVDPLGRPTSIDKEHQVWQLFSPCCSTHRVFVPLPGPS